MYNKGEILLGKYRVEGLAGRGTFGEVYHVLHPKQLSPRAIKVLRKDMPGVGSTDIQDARSRFEMEARLGDRLTHPNVIKVLEFEDEGDELFLIMEYAPGGSLKDRLKKGPLSINEAVRLGVEVCAGLQAIHERLHAVHRDIKPSNILFDGDGTARICDLGLVQLAGDESRGSRLGSLAGSQPGTPPYMSPEQENTRGYLTPSSDLFSVGCVLFEALTGKLYKDYLGTRVRDHRRGVPEWLDEIIARSLIETAGRIPADDGHQSRRYRTSLIMQGDLEQGQKGETAKQEAERQRLAELAATEERTRQKAEEDARKEAEKEKRQQAEELARQITAKEKAKRDAGEKAARDKTKLKPEIGIKKLQGNLTAVFWIVGIIAIVLTTWILSQNGTPSTPNNVPVGTSTQLPANTAFPQFTTTPLPTNNPILPTPVFGLGSRMTGEDGMTLLYVPEGEFTMGSESYDDEKPIHTVYLDAFWIDETEVTNKQYAGCVSSDACTPPSSNSSYTRTGYYGNTEFDNYPVIFVTWDQAQAYCEWAGRRLPTEAEWEKAARRTDGNTYPWGETDPDKNLVNFNFNVGDNTTVGKYPDGVSPYGAQDMAGNVWEWVNDWYGETYYQSSPASNPTGPDSGESRLLRGGSWSSSGSDVRSANRNWNNPTYTNYYLGFRCARSTSP